MTTDPYAGLAVLAPPDQRPGYPLTREQDAAEVAAGRLPAQHVRIDPQTWQRENVGGDPYAGVAGIDPNSAPGMSMAEDIGRSAVTGLEKGAAGVAGWLGDLQNLAGNGIENAGAWALGKFGVIKDPAAFRDQMRGTDDFAGMNGAATSHDVGRVIQGVAGPYHDPQTTPARYAETIASFAPLALAPGGPATKLANVVVPGAASETAGELAQPYGKGWETAARVLGGLGGGLAVGGAQAIANAPARAAGQALGDVTPQQLQLAAALRGRSPIPLTNAEAIQQVTGGATGMGRLQHFWENSMPGRDQAPAFFADRPQQVERAVQGFAERVAPQARPPGVVGMDAQRAAQGGLNNVRQTINRTAEADYQALEHQAMDPEAYAQVAGQPSYQAALRSLREDPEVGAAVAHLPDENLAVVNEVQKRLQTMADQAAGSPMAPGDRHLAAIRTNTRQLTDDLARDASQVDYGGEYGRARDTVSQLSRAHLDPLEAGPLGAISQTDKLAAQLEALHPRSPFEGGAGESATAYRVLGQQNPATPAEMLRSYLVRALDESGRDLTSGPNQYAGSKFAREVAGNREQAATLDQSLRTLPGGDGHAQDFGDLLEALRATGKRQPAGSMTAFNQEMRDSLGMSPAPVRNFGRIIDPLEWGRHLDKMVGNAMYRRQLRGIGDLLLSDDPASAYQSMQAAQQPALARALLGAAPAGQARH